MQHFPLHCFLLYISDKKEYIILKMCFYHTNNFNHYNKFFFFGMFCMVFFLIKIYTLFGRNCFIKLVKYFLHWYANINVIISFTRYYRYLFIIVMNLWQDYLHQFLHDIMYCFDFFLHLVYWLSEKYFFTNWNM